MRDFRPPALTHGRPGMPPSAHGLAWRCAACACGCPAHGAAWRPPALAPRSAPCALDARLCSTTSQAFSAASFTGHDVTRGGR
eukprot:2362037-Prymnesium_polylepis.1